MAAFGIAFGVATVPAAIVAFGFTYTLVSNVFSTALHAYGPELFPTGFRATAVGSCYSLSRLSTAAMPFVMLPVLDAFGATAMFVVLATAMATCALDVGVFGPATAGRALEQLNPGLQSRQTAVPEAHPRPTSSQNNPQQL
jgi:MFS transporter, putative metabolite:H+ symporter